MCPSKGWKSTKVRPRRHCDAILRWPEDIVRGSCLRIADKGSCNQRAKNLADALVSLLSGNREFTMIDKQKLVYETALRLAAESSPESKNVLIVEGGPGTGKSVVAINLLVALTNREKLVQYVSKNAAPRAVYESKLTGSMRKSRISQLFIGSGAFTAPLDQPLDVLLVDEAHRLNEKSGLYGNLGENQVKELIDASNLTVFFVDEDQRIAFKDIGRKSEIHRWAAGAGATVRELELASQFRCNGSDGYLAWLDNTLGVRETANRTLEGVDYDFRVCDSPAELRDLIEERNRANNGARMVAGYCWKWVSKTDSHAMDIVFPEHGFAARWNLATDGSLWILKPDSVKEVGCIHTCQGLELDYVGVVFGDDFLIRDGIVVTDASKRASADRTISGYRSWLQRDPDAARDAADQIVKNTYRTLMIRGQKGCSVWSVDLETNDFLKRASARRFPNGRTRVERIGAISDKAQDPRPLAFRAVCRNFHASRSAPNAHSARVPPRSIPLQTLGDLEDSLASSADRLAHPPRRSVDERRVGRLGSRWRMATKGTA